MTRSSVPAFVLVCAAAALAGCYKPNPFFHDHDGPLGDDDGSDGSNVGCGSDSDCTGDPGHGVCDTGRSECVACTDQEHAACQGMTPFCDDDACRGCASDAECPDSLFCNLEDGPDKGSCAATADVVYVDSGHAGTTCTINDPCQTLATGVSALGTRTRMKVTGSFTAGATFNKSAVVHATGADVMAGTSAIVVTDNGAATAVTIRDLRIHNVTGNGVLCTHDANPTAVRLFGVTVDTTTQVGVNSNTCDLVVSRSTVESGHAGGIKIVDGTYDITNSIIVNNGNTTTGVGGVQIALVTTTGNRFALNTVSQNSAPATIDNGVDCANNVDQPLSSNIVFGNAKLVSQSEIDQVNGCTSSFTDSSESLGNTNINDNPKLDTSTFHIAADSPVRGKGDPALTDVTDDFDGDPRPNPAGDPPDIGADEVP